jgi:hypothetical protein
MLADPQSATTQSKRAHAASYIASMTEELATIAKRHGLDTLGYLLEMARLEAENGSVERD